MTLNHPQQPNYAMDTLIEADDNITKPKDDDITKAILDFERSWWKYPAAKDTAIRETFAMTPTRYYQVLNTIIDQPEAAAYAPLVVHRLQRLREARRTQRTARLRGLA